MKQESISKMKYGFWGIVSGAIIAIVIGFAWGGWSTAATGKKLISEAVVANKAEICVSQFMLDLNHEEKLGEFEKMTRGEKVKFIENGAWDKMPGQNEADYGVARECSNKLQTLVQK